MSSARPSLGRSNPTRSPGDVVPDTISLDHRCRVSVVVPAHNRADVIAETLGSVRAQSFGDWECIVVDDASTDGTRDVAGEFATLDDRFRVAELPAGTRHQSAARNLGLALSRGELVSFLDSDDLLAVDKLDLQVKHLEADPRVDVSICLDAWFDGSSGRVTDVRERIARLDRAIDAILNQRDAGFVMNTVTPLWRRSVLVDIGGWNEDQRIYEDSEMALRALVHGATIGRVDRVLALVRSRTLPDGTLDSVPADLRDVSRLEILLHNWDLLERAGLTTASRRRLLARKMLRHARSVRRNGRWRQALTEWMTCSRGIGLPPPLRAVGAVGLVTPSRVSDAIFDLVYPGPARRKSSGRRSRGAEVLPRERLMREAQAELDRVLSAIAASGGP